MTAERLSSTSKLRTNENLIEGALDRRLLLYALAAGATLACSVPSQAEVLFTPSNAVLQGSGTLAIDLDHDGSADFSLVLKTCRSFSGYQIVPCLLVYGTPPSNEVAGDYTVQAAALRRTARIGSGNPFRASAIMATQFGYLGNWVHVKNHFLGVRFLINGEVHYGWVGFRSVTRYDITATLAGWAYETDPNKPIVAGDMGTASPLTGSINPTSLEILAAGHTGIDERRKRAAH